MYFCGLPTVFLAGMSSQGVFVSPSELKRRNCRAIAMHSRPGGGCEFGEPSSRVLLREQGHAPIWVLWEVGDLVGGLGKEGTGAVGDHCSGMRQAFCMIAKGEC